MVTDWGFRGREIDELSQLDGFKIGVFFLRALGLYFYMRRGY